MPSVHPTITADAVATAQFAAWKCQLLQKLKVADAAVKLAISLPLFLPSIVIWSALYWFSKFDKPTGYDPYALVFTLLNVFLFHYFFFLTGLGKLSKRHKKMKLIDMDWSKPKYQELADAVRESGINAATLTGKITVDDSWSIHTYPRAREIPPTYEKLMFIYFFLTLLLIMFVDYLGATLLIKELIIIPLAIILITFFCIYSVFAVLDIFRPRFTLAVSTRVLTYLKGNPDRFRLSIAHELSHIRHRDPVRRVIWESRGEVGGFSLFWGAIACILVNVLGVNVAPAWAFIVCLFSWFFMHCMVSPLVPQFQELRADLEAIKSTSDRELLLQLLRGIPIESKHQSYLNRKISLRQLCSVIRDVKHLIRISDEKDAIKQRISMLETGEIAFISNRWFRLKLLTFFAVVLLTAVTCQIYMWRLAPWI